MSSVLIKEIRNVALMTLAFGAVQLIAVYAAGYFGSPAVFGTVLGCALAVLNFSLMGIILEICMSSNKGAAGGLMGAGYIFRLALIAAVVIWAIKASYINYICVIIPLVFPRIAIFILNRIRKDSGENERT